MEHLKEKKHDECSDIDECITWKRKPDLSLLGALSKQGGELVKKSTAISQSSMRRGEIHDDFTGKTAEDDDDRFLKQEQCSMLEHSQFYLLFFFS